MKNKLYILMVLICMVIVLVIIYPRTHTAQYLTNIDDISSYKDLKQIYINGKRCDISYYYEDGNLKMSIIEVFKAMDAHIYTYKDIDNIFKDSVHIKINKLNKQIEARGREVEAYISTYEEHDEAITSIKEFIEIINGAITINEDIVEINDYWYKEQKNIEGKEVEMTNEIRENYYNLAKKYRFDFAPNYNYKNPSLKVNDYILYAMYQVGPKAFTSPVTQEQFQSFMYNRFRLDGVKTFEEDRNIRYVNGMYSILPGEYAENTYCQIFSLSKTQDSNNKTIYNIMLKDYGELMISDEVVKQSIIDGSISQRVHKKIHLKFYYDNDDIVILYSYSR